MEFSNQYLTYEEYKGLGGTIDLMPFNLLEFESRRKIDVRTQNRLKNINSNQIPQEVKLCEYKMIEIMSKYDKKINEIVSNTKKSENIDGYSVTYATQEEVEKMNINEEQEIENVMETYLMDVVVNGEHIMYLGVC